MELWIGVVGVFMAALGGFASVYPPQERQHKLIYGTAFGTAGLLLVALLWIHTSNNANEKQQAAEAQKETRATLLQSQKEFREFRGEIVLAQKESNKPGSADEKLSRIDERLSRALGKPTNPLGSPVVVSGPQGQQVPLSGNPFHFNGVVELKVNKIEQLYALLQQNGYKGPPLLYQLEICAANTNTTDFYVGQSNVNAKNGFPYQVGECNTLWNQDVTQIYVFSPSGSHATLSATSR
jgi:hypothetical protein